jgi:hypothetical protein
METAGKVQDVLSKNGSHIRVRLGVHDAKIGNSDNSGIILLQICAQDSSVTVNMEKELQAIPGVKVKYMVLD